MGRVGKLTRKMKKAALKRSIKAANAAKYAALRAAGQNSKSKRFIVRLQKEKRKTIKHITTMCGNIGCKRCDVGKIFSIKPKSNYTLDIKKMTV